MSEVPHITPLLRDQGGCGLVSPDGKRVCAKHLDHEGPHGWESEELQEQIDYWCHAVPQVTPLFDTILERERLIKEALGRVAMIAQQLLQMIPPEVWHDQGDTDMQGHVEGDYLAARIEDEIAKLGTLAEEQ